MYSRFFKGKSPSAVIEISVSPADTLLTQGETRSFKASTVHEDGSQNDITSLVQWSVTGNATLGSNGSITAGTSGTAEVTVTYNGMSDTAKISIEPLTTIFVSATTGNDSSGNGSSNNPYKTIEYAYAHSPSALKMCIASGNYNFTSQLTISSSIAVYGGYSPSNWSRDIRLNKTIISDISGMIGGPDTPAAPIIITTDNPELNGLYINGGAASSYYTAAVHVMSGYPSFVSCTLNGGAGTYESTGLKMHNALMSDISADISYCDINGGSTVSLSKAYGIYCNPQNGSLNLHNSTVSVTNAMSIAYAIYALPSTSLSIEIYNSKILSSAPATSGLTGIVLYNSIQGHICNNTIVSTNTGSGPAEGLLTNISLALIYFDNNIVQISGNTSSVCINKASGSYFAQISANLFFVTGSAYYYFKNSGTLSDWSASNPIFTTGDYKGNPLFVSSTDLHLQGNSPAKNTGLNGLSLTPVWTNFPVNSSSDPIDLDQNPRPSGSWSIGAYQ